MSCLGTQSLSAFFLNASHGGGLAKGLCGGAAGGLCCAIAGTANPAHIHSPNRRALFGRTARRIDLPRGSIRLAMHKEEAPLDCPEQDGRKVRGRNRLPFRSHIALARTRRQPAIRHRAKGVSGFLTKGSCRGRTQQTYFRAPRNPKASTCPYQLGSSMPLRSARWPPSVPSLSCSNRGRSASTPNPLGGGDGHDPKDQGHEDCGNEPTDVIRVEHAPTTYIKFYLLVTILSGRPSSTLMNCGPIALRFPKI